jgi:hypothetical protein
MPKVEARLLVEGREKFHTSSVTGTLAEIPEPLTLIDPV